MKKAGTLNLRGCEYPIYKTPAALIESSKRHGEKMGEYLTEYGDADLDLLTDAALTWDRLGVAVVAGRPRVVRVEINDGDASAVWNWNNSDAIFTPAAK